jgi:steroid delta-isomerase-like uncharacterized protein
VKYRSKKVQTPETYVSGHKIAIKTCLQQIGTLHEIRKNVSVPSLVQRFYDQIWNAGNLAAVSDLLSDDFSFRGSLGSELRGREAFEAYVHSVRNALADYRCEILECVTEGSQAFAKMRFSGTHVSAFRGYPPTGKPVYWLGAALFRLDDHAIAELWVLGDLAGLEETLAANQQHQPL